MEKAGGRICSLFIFQFGNYFPQAYEYIDRTTISTSSIGVFAQQPLAISHMSPKVGGPFAVQAKASLLALGEVGKMVTHG